ncbi:MAG: nickel transporter [Deltaproteobacteria bacterium]|nr:MAG: nickel transporter [Deltaproteobacteria bacterium]
MKNYITPLFLIFCLTVQGSMAFGHTFWVNTFDSTAHQPRHVLVTLGYGHGLPLDDLLTDLTLESFTLYDPELKATALPLPAAQQAETLKVNDHLQVVSGDLAARKIILGKDSPVGVYQVSAESQDNYWTCYIDKKGQKRWVAKPMNAVTTAQKILRSMRYHPFAVSYFTVGTWQTPQSLGQELEIIPMTDLSTVHAGDLVKFKVLFMGKVLSTDPSLSIEYITAKSDAFGAAEQFSLASMLFDGKGQFRLPSAGNWLVNVYTRQNVTENNALKHLADKCTTVLYSSSVTFTVKP